MSTKCTKDYAITVTAPAARYYYWTLDESGYGNRVDSVAGLTLTAAPHIGGGYVSLTSDAGKFSNAVRFQNIHPVPGDLQQAVGPSVGPYLNQLAHDANGFSLCFWIKISLLGDGVGYVDYLSQLQRGEIALMFSKFGMWVRCKDNNEVNNEDVPIVLSTGTWYFIHLFHDTTLNKMGFSVNNGAETYASFTPTITAAVSGMVALYQSGFFSVLGPNDYLVDETIVRLDSKFTAAQLAYLYNGGAGRTWPISLP